MPATHKVLLIAASQADAIINGNQLQLVQAPTTPEAVQQLSGVRLRGNAEKTAAAASAPQRRGCIVSLQGMLVNSDCWWRDNCCSYAHAQQAIFHVIEEGYTDLVLDISSWGGESAGAFAFADFVHSLPELFGINTAAFVGSNATSAAYLVAAATQKIYAHKAAQLASIGTVAIIQDQSKADEKAGVVYEVIRSRPLKALGLSTHEAFSKEMLAMVEAEVLQYDKLLVEAILRYRPKQLNQAAIDKLAGASVFGEEAVQLGLADAFANTAQELFTQPLDVETESEDDNATTEETTMSTQSADTAKVLADERARVKAIMDAGKTFGIASDTVQKAIDEGHSTALAVGMFETIRAGIDAATVVSTAKSGITASASSEEAQRIAAAAAAQNPADKRQALLCGALRVSDLFAE